MSLALLPVGEVPALVVLKRQKKTLTPEGPESGLEGVASVPEGVEPLANF